MLKEGFTQNLGKFCHKGYCHTSNNCQNFLQKDKNTSKKYPKSESSLANFKINSENNSQTLKKRLKGSMWNSKGQADKEPKQLKA